MTSTVMSTQSTQTLVSKYLSPPEEKVADPGLERGGSKVSLGHPTVPGRRICPETNGGIKVAASHK